jgi:hypothetical protein
MTPRDVAPGVPGRVVLVEEVVLALIEDQPVRVVHPVPRRTVVELRTVRLVVTALYGSGHCPLGDGSANERKTYEAQYNRDEAAHSDGP